MESLPGFLNVAHLFFNFKFQYMVRLLEGSFLALPPKKKLMTAGCLILQMMLLQRKEQPPEL